MENTLNIQISLNDEQLSSLIKGNIEKLPDEKLQDIFSNALIDFFKTENAKSLFYKRECYTYELKPTDLLVHMIENAVSKDLLKPCVDEFIESIKNNYENLLKETMIATFSNMFFTQLDRDAFKSELHNMIFNTLNNR